jgi:putative ABC transport system ATP-binding protein
MLPPLRAAQDYMPLLSVNNVSKDYGSGQVKVQALRGVSATVDSGEFLAVMGPSGCGKSTLLHVMGGIDPPTSGQVLLDGQDLGAMDDTARSILRRRRIGFVFQRINLLPTLSAVENVALPLRIDGIARQTAQQRAAATLEIVGMHQRAAHFPHEMSGGEQQRVAIARALVIEPTVIMADEPTGALDSTNAQRILDLLGECARRGQTIVMVTHDPNMARQASRILQMQDGRIAEAGELAPEASTTSAADWNPRA